MLAGPDHVNVDDQTGLFEPGSVSTNHVLINVDHVLAPPSPAAWA
jgi:hypothetical protein